MGAAPAATMSMAAIGQTVGGFNLGFPNFIQKQWATLESLVDHQPNLQPINSSFSTKKLSDNPYSLTWIIDFGASNHMTWNYACLSNVVNITPQPIILPNGKITYTKRKGKTKVETSLTLDNVLFTPKITCQLIPISQLMRS